MAKLSLNNVTLAQEIDGVAHIDSATSFPGGHVIQVKTVHYEATAHSLFTDDTQFLETTSALRLRITPKYQNSMLLITYRINGQANGTWGKSKIMRSDDNGSTFSNLQDSSQTLFNTTTYEFDMSEDSSGFSTIIGVDFPNTTSEVIYNGFMRTPATQYWPHASTHSFGWVMEIKQ